MSGHDCAPCCWCKNEHRVEVEGRPVVSCVWWAWSDLRPDDRPSYEWAERVWFEVLRDRRPRGNALPNWLRMELWSRWRMHLAAGRPEPSGQLTFDLGGAA